MMNLTKDNFDEVISSGKVFVDFAAAWCGYCRIMEPIVEELADKYDDAVKIAKVDVDEEATLAAHYDITTYPTFIMFENGVETDRKTGAQPVEELESMLGQ